MYQLSLTSTESSLILHGPGAESVICGAQRSPAAQAAQADGTCVENIDLHLRGLPAQIDSLIGQLEALLAPDESRVVALNLISAEGETEWRSALAQGQVQYLDHGSASRARGSQMLRLSLQRMNAWEGGLKEAALSNPHGSMVMGGLQLDNHSDGGHACWADVDTSGMAAGLPSLARVEIANSLESSGQMADLWLGDYRGTSAPPECVLEGELGLTGYSSTLVSDSTSSNGLFRRVTFTASGELVLLKWTLSAAQLAAFGGLLVRPLVRFASAFSDSDLWAQLRLMVNASVTASSNWMLLQAGQKLQDLPALQLPPWPLPADAAPAPLSLAWVISRAASTSCVLDVDFVHLTPAEGWRKFSALRAMTYGATLVDDRAARLFYTFDPATGASQQHAAAGPGVMLWPGQRQRLYLLHGGADCEIAYRSQMRVFYRPRRRMV